MNKTVDCYDNTGRWELRKLNSISGNQELLAKGNLHFCLSKIDETEIEDPYEPIQAYGYTLQDETKQDLMIPFKIKDALLKLLSNELPDLAKYILSMQGCTNVQQGIAVALESIKNGQFLLSAIIHHAIKK